MANIDKISRLINKIVDSILKGDYLRSSDIDLDSLSRADKEYIVESLQDSDKIEQRNKAIREFDRSKTERWNTIQAAIGKSKESKTIQLYKVLKIAAAVLVVVFVGYKIYNHSTINMEDSYKMVSKDSVRLELQQGGVQELSTAGVSEFSLPDGEIVGLLDTNYLHYKKGTSDKLKYHELHVPNGKQFKVELSDGTVVSLNSGSSLRYPMQFTAEGKREVFLKGEAYFEVARDESRPFLVRAHQVNVRVLGTKFVVNSYKETSTTQTVLVEGSVALYKEDESYKASKSTILQPGQLGELDMEKNEFRMKEVNTENYLDWMEGKLSFNHKSFPMILKRLERHFNVTIDNRNQELSNQVFTASFDHESLEEILNVFRLNFPFEYTKINNDKTIIINP